MKERVDGCWNELNERPTIPQKNLTISTSPGASKRQSRQRRRLWLKGPSIRGFQPLSADSPKKYLRGRQPISAGLLTQRHNLLCQEGQDPISADPFSPQKHHPGDQLQMDQIQRGLLLEQSPVASGHLVDHDMLKVCPSDH